MIKVQNKTFEIKGVKASYKDLMLQANDTTPKDGFTTDEIKKRLRIDGTVKKFEGKKEIIFEDSDFEKIKILINEMRWSVVAQEIADFVDYINSLKPI